MSHDLSQFADGRHRMAAWGRIPVWHGLGQRSDRLMTVNESAELGGWDYPVVVRPSLFADDDGEIQQGDGVQIVRADTMKALGQASDQYSPINNRDAFSILQPFIDSGELKGIMTCGVLRSGERAWCQAVINEFSTGDDDRGLTTLLIQNDHTGSQALRIGFTTISVVCGNTYSFVSNQWHNADETAVMSIRHIGDVEADIEQMRNMIVVSEGRFKSFEEVTRTLAEIRIGEKAENIYRLFLEASAITDTTLAGWVKRGRASGHFRNMARDVYSEYVHGPGQELETRKGTAYGAFNAVTGWVDYGRSCGGTSEARTSQALFGSGAKIKRLAMNAAKRHFIDGEPWTDRNDEAYGLLCEAMQG